MSSTSYPASGGYCVWAQVGMIMIVRHIKKHLDSDKSATFVCGLDVHKQELAVAIYGTDRSCAQTTKHNIFPTDPAGLEVFWRFVSPYQPIGFVMEATGIYHHTIAIFLEKMRQSAAFSFEICIANPSDAHGLPGHQKHDRIDAERLAMYYAAGLLNTGKQIIPVMEDLKALFRMLERLEKDRTALKNRIKKSLDRAGFRPKELDLDTDWTNAFMFELCRYSGTVKALLEHIHTEKSIAPAYIKQIQKHQGLFDPFGSLSFSGALRALIRQDLYDLDLKTTRKTLLKVEIERTLQPHLVVRDQAYRVAQIPGISPLSAIWLLAEIGNIHKFHSMRAFLAYCGCVPRIASSAGVVYSAHITRHANKFLRGIFYQAAVSLCHVVKKSSGLKDYASRVYFRKQRTPKVAYCTIAAKVGRMVYTMLTKQLEFDTTLGLNKRRSQNSGKPTPFSIIELKDLRKASRLLKRIKEFQGLTDIETDISQLIQDLNEILAKK